jgi:hypothetical protein
MFGREGCAERQQGDLISILLFFQNKETTEKYQNTTTPGLNHERKDSGSASLYLKGFRIKKF